ncbi:glycoside hydrolase family 95-like protein [uncultured Mucilaginibacter sp.]|uniref:glycosyl hydrolase family 95 catalytic domain-containing protein n=1 Tax=uncultured Mucilaginibacter sp. TaxID=797541 RepID=UPI0025DC34C9|nr:glycoside hydrolase N-terminal domain-containing protein [uncultured Mucilaginibacter sp.]
MKKAILGFALFLWFNAGYSQSSVHDLQFDTLAKRWDEAIPLGNGMLGALVWQKDDKLRFSLDRADLWDLRPMNGLHRKEFNYQWVIGQVMKKDYAPVQQYLDAPYDKEPAPSRIPGGALEFATQDWGKVKSVHLFINQAICEVKWANGTVLKTFVHATAPVGWFRFENVKAGFKPQLIMPKFQGAVKISGDPVGGDDLSRLGYAQGITKQQGNSITYEQPGWGGFKYEINVRWQQIDKSTIEGVWSISSQYPDKKIAPLASAITQRALHLQYFNAYASHILWWRNFWDRSAIHIPDTLLEKQWYMQQYKFGSASRKGAPPISLQAVWTADNGRIPPWKGDYHHDLNTQLSYWPCYSANHLEDGLAYLDHLDANKANYKRYTKMYFGKEGLAVPGVTTLDGTEMGGWIQYSLSPTVSSWLAQHYYLQWRYSMDRKFLKNRAYPWIKDVAVFLENIAIKDKNGFRKLPISSSPEINDNDLSAWFFQDTNYDLALMKSTFKMASELAGELGLKNDAAHWKKISGEFDDFALTPNDELMFSPTLAYNQSHRHFSHMMAIHPLGLIKWEDGPKSQRIIKNSIHLLDSIGPDYWCGYSYAWLANMKARAKDGEGAAKALQIFAKAFCSVNSFHLNGDQTKSGYSKFQYRPFTLEGNFAFAAGLQEMLIQSYAGFIAIMPALPSAWNNVSFENLRTEGAFLVSAKKVNGITSFIKIKSEKGGKCVIQTDIPVNQIKIRSRSAPKVTKGKDGKTYIAYETVSGEVVSILNSAR